jgi:hypothetical protein
MAPAPPAGAFFFENPVLPPRHQDTKAPRKTAFSTLRRRDKENAEIKQAFSPLSAPPRLCVKTLAVSQCMQPGGQAKKKAARRLPFLNLHLHGVLVTWWQSFPLITSSARPG